MATYLATARKDRLIRERNHDPYKPTRKPPEPCFCPVCGAVFKAGRWQWLKLRPAEANVELCQACQRARDHYPAGLVTISGGLVAARREELLNLVRNEAKAEGAQHPMHRILRIEQNGDKVRVSTADIHLPKRVGEALHRAYKGRLEVTYEKETCFVRVDWNAPS